MAMTLGPWRADTWRSPARIMGPTGSDALALVYLTDPATRKRSAEFEGNARAIAALPDLVDALHDLLTRPTDSAARERARAALAKLEA